MDDGGRQAAGRDGLEIRPATVEDRAAVTALWHRTGLTRPYNDPDADFDRARCGPASDVLVGERAGAVVASVMVGHDGHRGWLYYVAVDPRVQSDGLGRRMVAAGEDWLRSRNIPKVQLLVRATNGGVLAFYDRLPTSGRMSTSCRSG
ncbi:MAG TPA: GNAT family acetyltransferase [Thermomicrobiales bacterium]|jgi:hypothetical protein|nr:GNAT family acetyltransferase [Thermomicrobiales bacterium]